MYKSRKIKANIQMKYVNKYKIFALFGWSSS